MRRGRDGPSVPRRAASSDGVNDSRSYESETESQSSFSLANDRRSASERIAPSSSSVVESTGYGPHWSAKRHLTCGNPSPPQLNFANIPPWRQPDKLRTSNAALVVCLNIDVDPPDVVKTDPCATLECWVDPHSLPSNKALEAIGNNLHHQFECLSPRIKFKPYLDPSYEETQKFCMNLRKMAKDERCLFYYNGHGVPKPTPSGELWVFNRSYSQYIPVSLIEIQNWLGSPCIYIWDCSAAGNLLTNFINFAKKRDSDMNTLHGGYTDGMQPFMESIQLAACLAHEQLPMCPELPADLFTSCLTSPIDIALRWFVMQNDLPNNVTLDMVQRLPGDLRDRRTPLGELNWIFTAVTDTIAWTTFSREIFTKLYRSDLLIASLFRNFLLAERIMKNYHCTPHTYPPLPPTNTHAMWAQWDLAVDACLRQLPELLGNEETVFQNPNDSTYIPEKPYTYVPSRFFTDHLTAFEVWVSRGGSALTKRGPGSLAPATGSEGAEIGHDGFDADTGAVASRSGRGSKLVPRKPPEQLPILLQLLLSQPHRLRALILLSQFVDLGPWAVHFALAIGVFPFISKLLQSPAHDLRPVLIFIWARILAVDPSCQNDLYHSQGYKYFANALAARQDVSDKFPNVSEHSAMCCFVLSAICRGFPQGQTACWQERVFDNCFERLEEDDFLSRQWMALCIGQMWDGNDDIKIYGVDRGTQDKLIAMLADNSAEVRTAALFALGTFMGGSGCADPSKRGGGGTGSMYHLDERTHFRLEVAVGTGAALTTRDDASPMVRKELLVLLSCLVKEWRGYFVIAAWVYWEEEHKRLDGSHSRHEEDIVNQAIAEWLDGLGDDDAYREDSRILLSSFYTIYVFLLEMSVDAYPEVAAYAQTLVDYVMALLLESPFTRLEFSTLDKPPPSREPKHLHPPEPRSRLPSLQSNVRAPFTAPSRVPLTRSDSATSAVSSGSSNILRRTASFANSLKSFAGSYAFPPSNSDETVSKNAGPTGFRLKGDYADASCPPSPNLNVAEYCSPYLSHSPDSPARNPVSHSQVEQHGASDYLPCEVMEALIEEDMERLRARRRKKTQPRLYQQYAHSPDNMPSPSGSTFSHDSAGSSGSVPLGLGTGAGFKDVLPLKSRFYDWCCEYFTETQMRQPESEEPGSVQYNEQMWRRQRNEKVLLETDSQAELAAHCPWDRPVATIHHGGYPLKLAFHGYDPHLFVANENSMISVYDWTQRKRLLVFNNGNPVGTSITSLHCINQDVGGMIMAGSSDGIIHLYRNYDPAYFGQPLQMVSSFRALNTVIPVRKGSGLVLEWQQGPGIIIAGGDSRAVKVWDAHRECALSDILTQSESPVTSLTTDPENNMLFIAGFGDGNIKLFDRRLEEGDSVVRVWREHSSWVQSVRWQKGSSKDLLSAGLDGEVKLWDLRRTKSSISRWMLYPDGLAAFEIHPKAAVFAASSALSLGRWRQQSIIIHSLDALPPNQPVQLSQLNVPTGLHGPPQRDPLSSSIPGMTSLAFHPNEMILGIGGVDGIIKLTGCKLSDEDPLSLGGSTWMVSQNGRLESLRSMGT